MTSLPTTEIAARFNALPLSQRCELLLETLRHCGSTEPLPAGLNLDGLNFQDVFERDPQAKHLLRGLNAPRISIRSANLAEVDLTGARLPEANFQNAFLSQAKLPNANLTKANLSGAHLGDASLRGARLVLADLRDVFAFNTSFVGARMAKAQFEGAIIKGDFRDARLWRTNFTQATLHGSNFNGAQVGDAIWP